MSDNQIEQDVAQFSVSFTRAIFTWNEVEEAARQLLRAVTGPSLGVTIATLHLSNLGLQDSLKSVADMSRGKMPIVNALAAEHILHFVAGMDVLRVHRNFYVHAIRGFGKSPYDQAVFQGTLLQQEAKGRLATVYETVTTNELGIFVSSLVECARYARSLVRHFEPPNALTAFAYTEPVEPLENLAKPVWISMPKKERRYWSEGRFF